MRGQLLVKVGEEWFPAPMVTAIQGAAAPVAEVVAAATNQAASGTAGTLTVPAGVEAGDVILVWSGSSWGLSAITLDGTTLTGTELAGATAAGFSARMFVRVANGSEGGTEIATGYAGSHEWRISVAVLRGVNTTAVDSSASQAASGVSRTTSVDAWVGDLLVGFAGFRAGSGAMTSDLGTTEVTNTDSPDGGVWSDTAAGGANSVTFAIDSSSGGLGASLAAFRPT